MIPLVGGIDGVIAYSDPFSARVIGAADRLRIIARTGAGYDKIDVSAATARGIVVSTTSGNRRAVAEYAFALMMVLSRRMLQNLSEVRQGRWVKHEGTELGDKTLGIIGLGAIGKDLARRARAFEMRLLAFDPVRDEVFAAEQQISYVSLEEVLRESDFVSLHLPLASGTRHLMNAERLALMKPSAFLVNTARGAVVDTEALYHALKERRLAGAALDVVEQEPLPPDSPLRELDNVLLSAHVAGYTTDAQKLGGILAADNVLRVFRGEPPISIVNPEALR